FYYFLLLFTTFYYFYYFLRDVGDDDDSFNDAERAALNFSLAASQVPNNVNETIIQELHKHWDEGEIVEILGVISLFGYLNRWNDSMGTSIEEGAIESAEKYLQKTGWVKGKHV
ncbi:MAG TPA: hypothetical protein QF889_00210, partial [Flavobacteriaceae bacterium]|nr:hypothetical protein [Flavobacteriaceae bacterium]